MLLKKAEPFRKLGRRDAVSAAARGAVQMAENATLLALKQLRRSNWLGNLWGQMFVSEDLITSSIAELAKEEMAFTIGIGADGKKLYLIDSVALSEGELVLRYEKHALTRAGICRYLVARAA